MTIENGRVPEGTGLSSSTEPASGLGPPGFDPSRWGLPKLPQKFSVSGNTRHPLAPTVFPEAGLYRQFDLGVQGVQAMPNLGDLCFHGGFVARPAGDGDSDGGGQ